MPVANMPSNVSKQIQAMVRNKSTPDANKLDQLKKGFMRSFDKSRHKKLSTSKRLAFCIFHHLTLLHDPEKPHIV
jgi:hypothetical protein